MPYTLLVCADLYGNKVNLELGFPSQPTLQSLKRYIEQVFSVEIKCLRPPNAPTVNDFVVSRMQIYDDIQLKWVDLTSPTQLHEYDQIYCFQQASPWQTDEQKDLPAPRPPSQPVPFTDYAQGGMSPMHPAPTGSAYGGSPMPHPAPAPAAPVGGGYLPQPMGDAALARERPNVPLQERINIAFQEMDENKLGYLTVEALERGFRTRGIDFSAHTVGELFQKGDMNCDGRLDWNEWNHFAAVYPNTVDAVYYRGRDISSEQQLKAQLAALQAELEAGRAKEAELRGAADAQAQHNKALQRALQDQEAQLREAGDRRNLLEGQERALIEQEVKLERQKDALRNTMHRFKETAAAFDRDAMTHGSPRRSRNPDQSNLTSLGV